ncbi:PQQ-binding-like beta-propeller repeat protein [Candidatus Magnetaquicoccus inordinatus]|uniref:outer membrane protein assembly factor BamB family protein n=1 Tax=Candidatus Magnetaquicoccus inordinatus TaxID=2496818 RepID=UPI00102BAA65|nr:PQQ-binding-like beta-propeller repeat protein [Candidatus Magnetaquicoccus inordinatus]
MKRWQTIGGMILLLLGTGCSSLSSLNPFKEGPEKSNKGVAGVPAYVEPQVKESAGLTRIWKTSVARSAGKFHQHPAQIVVTEEDIFVGTFQGRVVRLSRESGRVLWEVSVAEQVSGGVAVDERRVFAGTRSGEMVALSRETGEILWRADGFSPVTSAPAAGGGRVIFQTLSNHTHALNVVDGKRIWKHSTPPEPLVVQGAATPVIEGPVVFVGYSSGDLFALLLESGAPLWNDNLSVSGGRSELDLLQGIKASVVLGREEGAMAGGKKLFAVNHQGRAVALLPRNGARIWEHKMSAVRRPWFGKRQLFFSDMDGYVLALSAGEGLELWRTRVSDGLLSATVAAGNKVIVADDKGRLFALDSNSGRVIGMDRLGEAILADPVLLEDRLFLWSNDGNLMRYDF